MSVYPFRFHILGGGLTQMGQPVDTMGISVPKARPRLRGFVAAPIRAIWPGRNPYRFARRDCGPAPHLSQRVSGTAHRAQRVIAAMHPKRLAQAADVHINGAGIDIDVAPPDPIQQLFA